ADEVLSLIDTFTWSYDRRWADGKKGFFRDIAGHPYYNFIIETNTPKVKQVWGHYRKLESRASNSVVMVSGIIDYFYKCVGYCELRSLSTATAIIFKL
ncbi:hypothetical protein CEXT_757711, partial [Caerostris extrusa]